MDNRRQTQVCRRLSFAWLFGAQFEKQLDVVLAKARSHNHGAPSLTKNVVTISLRMAAIPVERIPL
jgi:hypothetical protein